MTPEHQLREVDLRVTRPRVAVLTEVRAHPHADVDTKIWPNSDYPLIKVDTMTLNKNPDNFFAQIEQAAFSPGNIVPGIGFSPDKMLLGRTFALPTPTATGSAPTSTSCRSTARTCPPTTRCSTAR